MRWWHELDILLEYPGVEVERISTDSSNIRFSGKDTRIIHIDVCLTVAHYFSKTSITRRNTRKEPWSWDFIQQIPE